MVYSLLMIGSSTQLNWKDAIKQQLFKSTFQVNPSKKNIPQLFSQSVSPLDAD